MAAALFACPKCQTQIVATPEVGQTECGCPGCGSDLEAFFFPALYRPRQAGAAATLLVDQTEASCFYHPQKQAAQVCDGCGRLICSLCSIPMGNENLCPNCLSAGRRKGKITVLETSRTCYDKIALSIALLGIIFYVFAIVIAPVVIYMAIRHWNSPGSVMGVSHTRFIIAIVLAAIELLGFCALFLPLFFLAGHHAPVHH